jgi:hypothetical protein
MVGCENESTHCGNEFLFQSKTEGKGLTNQILIQDVGKVGPNLIII